MRLKPSSEFVSEPETLGTGDVIYAFRDGRDITPPVIAIGAVVENRVYAAVLDDVDHNPSFESQLVGSSILCTSSLTTGFLAHDEQQSITLAGGQKACFRAEDSAGNISYAASTPGIPAPVDTIPPAIAVVYNSEGNYYRAFYIDDISDQLEAYYSFVDSVAGCSINAAWQPYNHERLAPRTNQTVCFRVQDSAGNVSYADPSTPPDTVAPVVTLSALAADGTISAQASDDSRVLLGFGYKVINAFRICTETVDVKPYHGQTISVAIGEKACFVARDIAGNTTAVESAVR